jgi:hypothetical protein
VDKNTGKYALPRKQRRELEVGAIVEADFKDPKSEQTEWIPAKITKVFPAKITKVPAKITKVCDAAAPPRWAPPRRRAARCRAEGRSANGIAHAGWDGAGRAHTLRCRSCPAGDRFKCTAW